MNSLNTYYGTGRRKTACARVFLKEGEGKIIINNSRHTRNYNNNLLNKLLYPINVLGMSNKFNLYITVKGGGISGQLGAIIHGISRALVQYNISFKTELKKLSLLTRDSRQVERKKVGLKKSRKAPQYSKR